MKEIIIELHAEAGQWYAEVTVDQDPRVFVVSHQKTPLLVCKRAIEIAERVDAQPKIAETIPMFQQTAPMPKQK